LHGGGGGGGGGMIKFVAAGRWNIEETGKGMVVTKYPTAAYQLAGMPANQPGSNLVFVMLVG
jgi:hypothetical protein